MCRRSRCDVQSGEGVVNGDMMGDLSRKHKETVANALGVLRFATVASRRLSGPRGAAQR